MKKLSTLLGLLSLTWVAQAQTCPDSPVVIASTKDSVYSGTTLKTVTHTSLWYNEAGLPFVRRTYNPNTQEVLTVEEYYYTGTKLDSIVAFTDETTTTKTGNGTKFEYDANGNLTKVTKTVGSKQEVTSFTYTSNKLSSVTSAQFTVTNVTFNSANNLNTAEGTLPFIGKVTGTFSSDANINPFSGKLGLNEDVLSYFNTNNLLNFEAQGTALFSVDYTINSDKRPTRIVRTELVTNSIIKSTITYGCLKDLISSVNDTKITQTSNIAPNPSKDGLFHIAEDMNSVIVRDVTGAFVLETNNNRLDLSAQKSGMYFLEIKTDSGLKVAKIVKE